MPRIGFLLLVCLAFTTRWAQPAVAIPFFGKVFSQEYIQDHENKEYVEFVKKKAKCWVCHQGKKKKNHNEFGEHLVELLDKKKDKKDKEKVLESLKKVLALHSDPKNEKSPTYLELIKQSKLPGGELEDLKKEPKESKESEKEETDSQESDAETNQEEPETKEEESSRHGQ